MKVAFLDLKTHHARRLTEFEAAIRQVVENNAFAGGPFVERFEKQFAPFCDCHYAVGLGSGLRRFGWFCLRAVLAQGTK